MFSSFFLSFSAQPNYNQPHCRIRIAASYVVLSEASSDSSFLIYYFVRLLCSPLLHLNLILYLSLLLSTLDSFSSPNSFSFLLLLLYVCIIICIEFQFNAYNYFFFFGIYLSLVSLLTWQWSYHSLFDFSIVVVLNFFPFLDSLIHPSVCFFKFHITFLLCLLSLAML